MLLGPTVADEQLSYALIKVLHERKGCFYALLMQGSSEFIHGFGLNRRGGGGVSKFDGFSRACVMKFLGGGSS
jgi:hypothetical protein